MMSNYKMIFYLREVPPRLSSANGMPAYGRRSGEVHNALLIAESLLKKSFFAG